MKKTRKKVSLVLVLVLLVQFLTISIQASQILYERGESSEDNKIYSYTISSILEIDEDNDFISYGFNGSGTEVDPYRIENLNITTSEDHCIFINNVSKYFVIQNCYLDSGRSAIHLYYIAHGIGLIFNNTCCNNYEATGSYGEIYGYGMEIQGAPGTTIIENTCYSNDIFGILISESPNSEIQNNHCYNNTESGILVLTSDETLVEDNICHNNTLYGIELYGRYGYSYWDTSNDCTVKSNICYDNSAGISMFGVNNTIEGNLCYDNEYGITILSDKSLILSNTLRNNEYGAYLDGRALVVYNNTFDSNNINGVYCYLYRSIILYNTIKNNIDYGFLFEAALKNTIYYNCFTQNNLESSSQAYDSRDDNDWFHEDSKIGNYWDDLGDSNEYLIAGSGEAKDEYPLNSCFSELGPIPPIPEIPDIFEDIDRIMKFILNVLYSVIGISVIVAIIVGLIVLRKYWKRKNKDSI